MSPRVDVEPRRAVAPSDQTGDGLMHVSAWTMRAGALHARVAAAAAPVTGVTW